MVLTTEQKIKVCEIITLALQLYQQFTDPPTREKLGHVIERMHELIA